MKTQSISFQGKFVNKASNVPTNIKEKFYILRNFIHPKPYDVEVINNQKEEIVFNFSHNNKRRNIKQEYIYNNLSHDVVGKFFSCMLDFEEKILSPKEKIKKCIDNFIFKYILKI